MKKLTFGIIIRVIVIQNLIFVSNFAFLHQNVG